MPNPLLASLCCDGDYECTVCKKTYTRKQTFLNHMTQFHVCAKRYVKRKRTQNAIPPVAHVNVGDAPQEAHQVPVEEHSVGRTSQRRRIDVDNEEGMPVVDDDSVSMGSNHSSSGTGIFQQPAARRGPNEEDDGQYDVSETSDMEDDYAGPLCLNVGNLPADESVAVITRTTGENSTHNGTLEESNYSDHSCESSQSSQRRGFDDDNTYGSQDSFDYGAADFGYDADEVDNELVAQLLEINLAQGDFATEGDNTTMNVEEGATMNVEQRGRVPLSNVGTTTCDEFIDLRNYLPSERSSKFHKHEAKLLGIVKDFFLPPKLYDLIMKWARDALEDGYAFNSKSYKSVMTSMVNHYIPPDCKYKVKELNVPGVPVTKQYVFPLAPQLLRVLANNDLVEDAMWDFNLQMRNGERVYGESNTGDLFEAHCQRVKAHVSETIPAEDPQRHLHSPLIITTFDDSTMCSNLGRLTCQPIMAAVYNLNSKKRFRPQAVFPLGIIPPYPKTPAERKKDRKERPGLFLTYNQAAIKNIMEELLDWETKYKVLKVRLPTGPFKVLYPVFGFGMGDTEGHDHQVCHYGVHSSCIQKMTRDCDCPQREGDNPCFKCVPTEMAEIVEALDAYFAAVANNNKEGKVQAEDRLKALSHHPVYSFYLKFGYGGLPGGIFSFGTPFEMLHVFYLGTMKNILEGIFNMNNPPKELVEWYTKRLRGQPEGDLDLRPKNLKRDNSEAFPKAEFEARIRFVQKFGRRQSDRHMPRSPFKNGVCELTRLNGQEYPGLCLLSCVCMKGIFVGLSKKHPLVKNGVDTKRLERSFALLTFLSLSLELRLTQADYTETELLKLESDIRLFLLFFRQTIGIYCENRSSTGLRKTKFHAVCHFPRLIRFLGASANFFGGSMEALFKFFVKNPIARTSRKHATYQRELLERFCEHMAVVFNNGFELRYENNQQAQKEFDNLPTIHEWEEGGETTITSSRSYASSVRSKRRYKPGGVRFWCDKGPNNQWSTFLKGKCVGHNKPFHVHYDNKDANKWVDMLVRKAEEDGFDRVLFLYHIDTLNVANDAHDTFRCHPNYSGYPWHDWCTVNFEKNNGDRYQTAARIQLWGIFTKQESHQGVPGQVNIDVGNLSSEINPLFGILHPLRKDGPPPKDNILPFGQTDFLSKDVYEVDFDTVEGVAYVLPINKQRTDPFPKKEDDQCAYFAVPPRHTWGALAWDSPLLNPLRKDVIT